MYKNYNTNQITLPMDIEFMIPKDDLCFIVHDLVESIPEEEYQQYRNRMGASSYHPKMMLKVILYAYTQSIFSGRRIEASLNDSIRMMWLSQEQKPSYRTINRFRVNPMMDNLLKTLYVNFRTQLVEYKLIDEQSIFIDGTKLEASANKYTFVWKKKILSYQEDSLSKAKSIYDDLLKQEIIPEIQNESKDEITIDSLAHIERSLNQKIEDLTFQIDNEENVTEKKRIRSERTPIKKTHKVIKDIYERNIRYNEQLKILGDRKSYSKTDCDATFMRMKEDHMKNGQLKAGYNLQIATNNQFTLAYDVFPNPADSRTLTPFLNNFIDLHKKLPKYIVADAGYGSEENYETLIDEFEVTPLIPFNTYYSEQSKKNRTNIFNTFNWPYNEIEDYFTCPENHNLRFSHYSKRKNGDFGSISKVYQCEMCQSCPLRDKCISKNTKGNKSIYRNNNLEYFKSEIRKKLSDENTGRIYANRKIDVEPVFGFLKAILGYTRMNVRGKSKVKRDIGLALMAVNIRKMATSRGENKNKNKEIAIKFDFHQILSLSLLSGVLMSRTRFNIVSNYYYSKFA